MPLSLETLPTELLLQIVAHLDTARTLLQLSLTSKALNHFVQDDSFRVFVQTRFPSLQTPPFWRDAAHALTTLSRNWDRKAFVARSIAPPEPQPLEQSHRGPWRQQQRKRRQQTMGYQPVIDSYESWTSGNWKTRHEVVTWGAGAELMMRWKKTGDLAEKEWHSRDRTQRHTFLDQHHHMHDWFVYREHGTADGRDDITSVNLLHGVGHGPEHVLIGRANGRLDHVSISAQNSMATIVGTYATDGRSVRSATLNAAPRPILAACLADNAIALYPSDANAKDIAPLDEITAVPPGAPGRTWSSKFLCGSRLAVGHGPSGQPILVYEISPTGFSQAPLRTFDIQPDPAVELTGPPATDGVHTTSVYPIIPIDPSSAAGGAEGDIFLSGCYDGNIRLHDLRSPASSTAMFVDIVDNSAIYSLLAFGRERFVAGSSQYAKLKIFDLRMPGGKIYNHRDVIPPKPSKTSTQTAHSSPSAQNYNIYLYPSPNLPYATPNRSNPIRPSHNRPNSPNSPIYSLSAPSPISPTFYAGIENSVIQLDVVSILDRHPDPVFSTGLSSSSCAPWEKSPKWDPGQEAINLRLYERVTGNVRIKTQLGVDEAGRRFCVGKSERARLGRKDVGEAWDERWREGDD
ncbi:MAG: hypothetical protein HETSPECPRED_002778 [Heterodermia speciosa]|uniref:F-box domain-containing protein n=1 Tax=Heterodermia speciosa TaxID=116794 RepID=A0A8H3F338_9LECA|nr:MAG: hypothetical protein HETSPECPRED_002778 [Heterodermia speciosa]